MLKQFQLLENNGIKPVTDVVCRNFVDLFFSILIFEKSKGLCKKMLEAMTMAEHDGNVFCKQCYARKYGIRGVGFGVGAGALGMDTGDRFGNTESLPYV
jgi:hypothetical protein